MSADRDALWRVMVARRDHRHFRSTPVERETLERLLNVFSVAPSVGFSQPWQVTVIQDAALKAQIHARFCAVRAEERSQYNGERGALYDTLKLEAIRDAPVGLVVSLVAPDSPTLGTTSMPSALEYSVVNAITLLWLAATAEGLGMGWVSLLRPQELAELLAYPENVRPVAYLCLGYPELELKEPLLKTVGWAEEKKQNVEWR